VRFGKRSSLFGWCTAAEPAGRRRSGRELPLPSGNCLESPRGCPEFRALRPTNCLFRLRTVLPTDPGFTAESLPCSLPDAIAREAGVSPNTVTDVACGRRVAITLAKPILNDGERFLPDSIRCSGCHAMISVAPCRACRAKRESEHAHGPVNTPPAPISPAPSTAG
jgi:hypothetical protein